MAGVIGFVLVLALAISYYAYVAKSEVPRWGQENEEQWNELVSASMTSMAREAAAGVSSRATVAGLVPRAPEPESFDVPLLGQTKPVPPDGLVVVEPACAYWWVNVTGPTAEYASLSNGCIRFEAHPVYTSPFAYRIEYGGLVRVEGQDAFVSAGMPLKLRVLKDGVTNDPVRYDIALTMLDLRGPGLSGSVSRTDVPVDLIPGPTSSSDVVSGTDVTLAMKTAHPGAWKTWFEQRLRGADIPETAYEICTAASGVGCDPAAPTESVPDNEVRVIVFGPSSDATRDLSLSTSQGIYDVALR